MNKINPVKAAIMANKKNCGIHALNDTCYNVCASYKGANTAWNVSPQCEQQCSDFVERLRHDYYGTGYCGHHGPEKPVIWNQVPSYFPYFFERSGDIDTALMQSFSACDSCKYPNECKEKAKTDSYAVEGYRNPLLSKSKNMIFILPLIGIFFLLFLIWLFIKK